MHYPCAFGAQYTREFTVFTLWAPLSSRVTLQLYKAGSADEDTSEPRTFEMLKGADNVFSLLVHGDLHGIYYDFKLYDSKGSSTVSADPWAVACGVNGKRSMVVNLERTDPPGWKNDLRIHSSGKNITVWETHISDFSVDARSGVKPEWRGKYLAFTEQNTTLDSAGVTPTCVNYLKKLGITHVQLQPTADFYTIDERFSDGYNWGYDIYNYNCLEGSYSTDPFHGEIRINEFKQMVQSLHNAGIGVILDVVYNHTYFTDSWLDRTAHGQYYRHAGDGTFLNASGCGNETASDRDPFRNYMIKSVLFWAREYHIDGFRFDLMAIHDIKTMNMIREALDTLPDGAEILMYGEPWSCFKPAIHSPDISAGKNGVSKLSSRIGIFSDSTRNAISGAAFNIKDKGYMLGITDKTEIIKSAVKAHCGTGTLREVKHPQQTVQYVSCHDNFTLWDRICAQKNRAFSTQSRVCKNINRFAAGIYLTSAGISLLHSGEEFGRTKEGNGNSYNGPRELNAIKWENVRTNHSLVDWYSALIELRNSVFPFFNAESVDKTVFLKTGPQECIIFTRPCSKNSQFTETLICFNPTEHTAEISLPSKKWRLLCDGKQGLYNTDKYVYLFDSCRIPSSSVIILGAED